MTFLAAIGYIKDKKRIPEANMWNYFCEKLNDGLENDTSASFYCGNKAGRLSKNKEKRDVSADDYIFAANIGLFFHTPESYFKQKPLNLPQPSIKKLE